MNCTEFRRAYSVFADGLIDELGEVMVHRHLAECGACRRFHVALQTGVRELRRQPKVMPSADFSRRLERRLKAEGAPVALTVRQGSGAAATLMLLTLAAAGLFAFDLARLASPEPHPVGTLGPLPVIGSNAFRPLERYAAHDVTPSPFAVPDAGQDAYAEPIDAGPIETRAALTTR